MLAAPSTARGADPPDCRVPAAQGPLGALHLAAALALLGVLLLPLGAHTGSRMCCWETQDQAPGMK